MILSDTMIQEARQDGRLVLTGAGDELLNPASIDLTLSNDFLEIMESWNPKGDVLDPMNQVNLSLQYSPKQSDSYLLLPGQFVLGSTQQMITLDPRQVTFEYTSLRNPNLIGGGKNNLKKNYYHKPPLVGRVEGKSSLGRIGLMVHITAGFIDPGFSGTITLEFFNAAPLPIILREGMRICQLSFFETGTIQKDYSQTGKYQHQLGVTGSRGNASI